MISDAFLDEARDERRSQYRAVRDAYRHTSHGSERGHRQPDIMKMYHSKTETSKRPEIFDLPYPLYCRTPLDVSVSITRARRAIMTALHSNSEAPASANRAVTGEAS